MRKLREIGEKVETKKHGLGEIKGRRTKEVQISFMQKKTVVEYDVFCFETNEVNLVYAKSAGFHSRN